MPKTAAQKAARRRRRQNRAVRSVTVPVMSRGRVSQIIHSMGKGGKKRKRNRANANSSSNRPGGRDYSTSDGLSKSTVIVNNSTIEDTFQLRREKVTNILGTTGLSAPNVQLFLNPGNTILFPIFSQIAATYEEYRVKTLKFEYVTEAYTASGTNVSAGKVIMATNFDPDDANFATDTQAENYAGSVKGTAYSQMEHDVVMQGRKRHKGGMRDFSCNNYFVSSSANVLSPVTGAAKFYDIGNFQLVTNGNASTAEIGELYVTYQFVMIRPKQQTPIGQNLISAHFAATASNATAAAPFSAGGTSMVAVATGNLIPTFTATTCVIPSTFSGRLQINALWTTGSNNIAAVPTVSASLGGTIVANYSAGGLFSTLAHFLAAGTTSQISFVVDCVNGATLTFGGNTTMSAADCDIHLAQISSGLAIDIEKSIEDERDKKVELLLKQVALLSNKLALMTPCESPIEQKEADLERSVHISTKEAKRFGLFSK